MILNTVCVPELPIERCFCLKVNAKKPSVLLILSQIHEISSKDHTVSALTSDSKSDREIQIYLKDDI